MIKLERTEIMGMEAAIRGMRNPLNSWDKSDSRYIYTNEECYNGCDNCEYGKMNDVCLADNFAYILGENDLSLATKLCKAGSDHRKFLRQIFVSVDITAPLYFWKEYDTYKVGTTANSTSTMHKIHAKEFIMNDFSFDKMTVHAELCLHNVIDELNRLRECFIETKDKVYWYSMIQLLPSSYNQLRTCTLTYENLRNMYAARKNHKLEEWHTFCEWVETLPYAKQLIIGDNTIEEVRA